ncbi:MAG: SMI1/KNR4 family protein [Fibromonadales bacterium]|nr:SMI1/KNR4 family protein [Fibromonadales bacterium]
MSDIVAKLSGLNAFRCGTGASDKQTKEAEQALSLRFAEEYAQYIVTYGYVSFFGHELTGVCKFPRLNVVDVTVSQRKVNPAVPSDWYVVEEANIDGIVVWQSSAGEIWKTAPGFRPNKLCDSLCEYLGRVS